MSMTVPTQSGRHGAAVAWRVRGTVRWTIQAIAMQIGTLTRNSARQPKPAISSPPNDGPAAVPRPDIAPSRPSAPPSRAGDTVSQTSAIASTSMIAPPMPCNVRAAIRNQKLDAAPAPIEAKPNSNSPASSNRCRLTLSASRPALTIRLMTARK